MKLVRFIKKKGVIESQLERIYFPRSEFHCRFPSYHDMSDPVRWSTYHRSDFKKLVKVSQKDHKFQGNQPQIRGGMYPKTGNFYNPFSFQSYQSAVTPREKKLNPSSSALWYDRLLLRQKQMASYVVDQVLAKDPDFLINADNDYTCVLFSLPKPKKEKNPKIWSQFLSVYLIAITNKLCMDRGINIEMVRRSSFGCLRPSLAECGESIRISLGLCPKEYTDSVVDALIYLKKLFEDPTVFKIPLESNAIANTIAQYNTLKSTEKKTVNIQLQSNLWDTLWVTGDALGKSFASQLFRRAEVVEYMIDLICDRCFQKDLKNIFESTKCLSETFALPLKQMMCALKLKKTTMSFAVDKNQLKQYQWNKAAVIQDEDFWNIIRDMTKRLDVEPSEIRKILKTKTTEDLHSRFEFYVARHTFMPKQYTQEAVEDGYGSDSDEEGELTIGKSKTKIYAKKLITSTGMRAIQLIYAAAKHYAFDAYNIDPLRLTFSAKQMYYETNESLAQHPIPVDVIKNEKFSVKRTNIHFFDVNHCNTTHEERLYPWDSIKVQDKIAALDITSATSEEVRTILIALYKKRPNLEVIMTISSGLKNEQFMGDYNPYGTVRIFTKSRSSLDNVYDDLIQIEHQIDYKHPKESHQLRKTAKECGMTLTNSAILKN